MALDFAANYYLNVGDGIMVINLASQVQNS